MAPTRRSSNATLEIRLETRAASIGLSMSQEPVAKVNRPVIDRGLFRSTKIHGQQGADRGPLAGLKVSGEEASQDFNSTGNQHLAPSVVV